MKKRIILIGLIIILISAAVIASFFSGNLVKKQCNAVVTITHARTLQCGRFIQLQELQNNESDKVQFYVWDFFTRSHISIEKEVPTATPIAGLYFALIGMDAETRTAIVKMSDKPIQPPVHPLALQTHAQKVLSVELSCTETNNQNSSESFFERGKVIYKNNPLLDEERDLCIDDFSLLKRTCQSPVNYRINTIRHFCDGGCRNGACQPVINTTKGLCFSDDGGRNYFKAGNITFYPYQHESVLPIRESDVCLNDTHLIEKSCTKEPAIVSEIYPCPNGCSDGACKLAPLNITHVLHEQIPLYFVQENDASLVTDGIVRVSTLMRRFFLDHPDEYDLIAVFAADYENIRIPQSSLFIRVNENPAKGLGLIDNHRGEPELFGVKKDGTLKGIAYILPRVGTWKEYPEEKAFKPLLEEFAHEWAVGLDTFWGVDSYHWTRRLQSLRDFDAMREARPWKDNHDGTFSLPVDPCGGSEKTYSFSPFTLYLMGLADQKEITQPFLLLDSPDLKTNPCSQKIRGTAQYITIADLIKEAGKPRTIPADSAQRNFKIAFIVMYPQNVTLSHYEIDRFQWLANSFPERWAKATSCRSTINGIRIPYKECMETVFPSK